MPCSSVWTVISGVSPLSAPLSAPLLPSAELLSLLLSVVEVPCEQANAGIIIAPAITAAAILFAVLVFRFSLQANASYFKMEKSIERSRADAIEMLTRIHMADDGSVKKIAFLGGGDQSLVAAGDPEIRELRSTLLFDNTYASLYLRTILKADYLAVEGEELDRLAADEAVKDMDVWPGQDSVRIVGDTAVIRLPDPPPESNP